MSITLNWTRDPSVPYPNVWKTFQACGPNTDTLCEYVIKEITEDQFDEAYELYVKVYLSQEPMAVAQGVVADKDSVDCFKRYAFSSIKQKMGLACIDSATGRIAGVNFLYVLSKDDVKVSTQLQAQSPLPVPITAWYDTIARRNEGMDLFTKFGVDKILMSIALAVDADYTRRGIAQELLLARLPIGEAFNLKLTASGFSSKHAIHTAQKLGYQFEKKIRYKDLAKLDPRFEVYNHLPDDCEYNTYQSLVLN